MSIKLMSEIWDGSDFSGTDLLVLLALADSANDEGYCWPSHATIAKKCRIERRQAIRITKRLEESGAIVVERRFRDNVQISNLYKVVSPIALGVCHTEHYPSDTQNTTPVSQMTHRTVIESSFNRKQLLTSNEVQEDQNQDQETIEETVSDILEYVDVEDLESVREELPDCPFEVLVVDLEESAAHGENQAQISDVSLNNSITTLEPIRHGEIYLFEKFKENARAKGRSGAKRFPTLQAKRKFQAAEDRLGEDVTAAVDKALEMGIDSIPRIVAYVARYGTNGNGYSQHEVLPPAPEPDGTRVQIGEVSYICPGHNVFVSDGSFSAFEHFVGDVDS